MSGMFNKMRHSLRRASSSSSSMGCYGTARGAGDLKRDSLDSLRRLCLSLPVRTTFLHRMHRTTLAMHEDKNQ